MMKKTNLLFSIILTSVVLLFSSCKKEQVVIPTTSHEDNNSCDCESIPLIPGYSTGYNHFYEQEVIESPIFNPNDENEILYVINTLQPNYKKLIKYNLITKEKTMLFSGAIYSKPAWSKLNWIVFANGYNGLYKIRPDGSDLSLLIATNDGYQFSPAFNENGDKLLTYHAFYTQHQFPCKIWNLNGQLLDSMNYEVNQEPNWKRQSNLAFRGNDKIFIVDPSTKQIIKTHETFLGDPKSYSHGFVWLNENEAVVEHGYNIKKLNVWTGELTELFCSCDSRKYLVSDASGNGNKVIFNKIVSKVKVEGNPQNLNVYSSISIYDITNDALVDIKIE